MSSAIVRDAFEADLPTLVPGLRLERTENRDLPRNPPLVMPDTWMTLLYGPIQRRHVTMGLNPWVEETGSVSVVVLGRSGHGPASVVAEASKVQAALEGWMDKSGNVWFDSVGPVQPMNPEPDGEWFAMVVPCNYRAQERPVLP